MLQAESEQQRQAWLQAVQASIASAYRQSPEVEVSGRAERGRERAPQLIGWRFLPEASGPNRFAVHQQHRLSQRVA